MSRASIWAGLVTAIGLYIVSLAFYSSRAGDNASQAIFWAGTLLLILPAVLWISSPKLARSERIAVLCLLGLAIYLVKVMYSPVMFTFLDELQHWRTTSNILESGRLFGQNPILSVSPYFPGLEIVTHALISLSGLSIYQAGILVIGASRLLLILVMFAFFEEVGQSSELAGVATLLYMANPHFLLFDAQFGYESIAIPLALLSLFAAVRSQRFDEWGSAGLKAVAILALAAVIVTHHVTSFLLVGFYLAWAVLAALRGRRILRLVPTWLAVFGILGIVFWLGFVANNSLDYLTPPLTTAMRELVQLIFGERSPRQLFVHNGRGGLQTSRWLSLAGTASILTVLLSLPYGIFKVWQKYWRSDIALLLVLIACSYPVTLAFRYIPWGLVVASRTAPYIFVGIVFVLATGVLYLRSWVLRAWKWKVWRMQAVFSVWAMVIFLGFIASGVAAWGLPVLHRADSYTNSVDSLSVSAAAWSQWALGESNRFTAEQSLLWVLGSYGQQRAVTPDTDRIWTDVVFETRDLTDENLRILERGKIRYLALDRREGSQLLMDTAAGATPEEPLKTRLKEGAAVKSSLDELDNVSRIYDNGTIVIYDLGALTGER